MLALATPLLLAAMAAAQTFPSPNTLPPKVVHRVEPKYTREALEAKLRGTVLLSAIIGTDGRASDIKVVRGLGMGLDEKAIECLAQWRFTPGTQSGAPIAAKVSIEMNFRLPGPQ